MRRIVLTDANVIFGRVPRDYLFYAHAAGVISVRWSDTILDEVERNLAKQGRPQPRLRANLLRFMPECRVEITPESIAVFDGLDLPDPDDVHVMAAAYVAEADILCTDNTQHFPLSAMERIGAVRLTTDETLSYMMREYPVDMMTVHRKVISVNRDSTTDSLTERLDKSGCPVSASDLRELASGSQFVRSHERSGFGVTGYWRSPRA